MKTDLNQPDGTIAAAFLLDLPLDVVLAVLGLVALLTGGGAAILWCSRRLKRPAQEAPNDPMDAYRELLREGKLSKQEFDRIASLLNEGKSDLET